MIFTTSFFFLPLVAVCSLQSPAEPSATLPVVSPGHAYISPG